ncbi:MAG: hypothetical protein EA376_14255 [Phycisphaeraceae bacterium]|nr:MAG: hypothetical protein EA376_14255 [Phycisphaeraceae bacterium]
MKNAAAAGRTRSTTAAAFSFPAAHALWNNQKHGAHATSTSPGRRCPGEDARLDTQGRDVISMYEKIAPRRAEANEHQKRPHPSPPGEAGRGLLLLPPPPSLDQLRPRSPTPPPEREHQAFERRSRKRRRSPHPALSQGERVGAPSQSVIDQSSQQLLTTAKRNPNVLLTYTVEAPNEGWCCMRAIVAGQVGMDKKPYLNGVSDFAAEQGEQIDLYHVGDLMYKEAPDVRPGRILDLSWSRLDALRRAAFKDIIAEARDSKNLMVNSHATFRWRHGLFKAFDFDQVKMLNLDLYICLVDNIETVHYRLHNEHDIDATLKDCMVWREEEILATEIMAQAMGGKFYIVSRGRHQDNIATLFRLITRPDMKKVYPSFPMSHVVNMPDVLAEIDEFRAKIAQNFITFDPGDVDEKLLLDRAIEAAKEGKDFIDVDPAPHHPQGFRVKVREVLDIAGDIDGQIYMRDFKLIDQADMIVSYIPELPGGVPALSSGVERELHHAFEHTKDVYIVWRPQKNPSPFITETATKIFRTVDEALEHFEEKGLFATTNLFGH